MARISVRVSDKLKEACDAVGAGRVRQVLEDELLGGLGRSGSGASPSGSALQSLGEDASGISASIPSATLSPPVALVGQVRVFSRSDEERDERRKALAEAFKEAKGE